jgi:ABC-2 type transport system ATP-binding protein
LQERDAIDQHHHQQQSAAAVLGALAERDRLDGLAVRTATLEDVFLQLTGREYRA